MEDTEVICKESNLEMAMLEYFNSATVEQLYSLLILNAKLQSDISIIKKRLGIGDIDSAKK